MINSVNPLYLRITNINDQFKKGKDDNIFPIDKDVNIYTATIIIRAIFAKNGKYYPQLFLDDGLYKMLEYERIYISDGIDADVTNK